MRFFIVGFFTVAIWIVSTELKEVAASLPTIMVYPKDNLDTISKRLNIPKDFIIRANELKKPYRLKPGCVLRYPPIHRVKKGDSFSRLLRKYDLTEELLAGHNQLKKPYLLQPGQILYLSRMPLPKVVIVKKTPVIKEITKKPLVKKEMVHKSSSSNSQKFCWPLEKPSKILSPFGQSVEGKYNDGVNVAAPMGSSVLASQDGEVVFAGDKLKNYGFLILIKHANHFHTTYAHLDKILVKTGQKVKKGQKIGLVGKSGTVGTPQLHFEIRQSSKPVNPKAYLTQP
jgi:murein DD-endopeptidase MepM/ murein hydrolase activator NlpD